MADMLNITQRTVSYYEKERSALPIEVLIKYAEFFNVSLEYICGLSDDPQK